ncbi:class III lanthionine synthetase LanKC [Streptacidiphilus sp. N1-12]|uniref:Class III lanthionine synthetase LanKC n=2 Tax=Streptacidiphilus alkalitolerans TaxID=3342712 RepID=A0ABV6VCF2_9ACTN
MLGLHHVYAGADPDFYDHPAGRADDHRFAAADRSAPAGWKLSESGTWVYLTRPGTRLPDQGWKVHVSATTEGAEQTVELVSDYCLRTGVAHKFLPNRRIHLLNNSKYARRGSSGKLLTLYPADDRQLRQVLDELSPLLKDRQGPYILGDLRWADGPLYLRYGGFVQRWCTAEDGSRVLALADPDGVLVPDRRDPCFRVPPWLTPPDFVSEQMRAADATGAGVSLPYTVERALHFSNGGGIYLARDPLGGEQVVLREARPLAGLDGAGVDAVTRLRQEAAALRQLAGLDCVPKLLREFTVWEHHYLAVEYIEGEPLWQFMVRNNPLTRPGADRAAIDDYTARVLDIVDWLQQAVDAVHARGLVFGDLHPANVMLRPDGRICLVDFEVAHRPEVDRAPSMGCPGFVAAHAATGTARDQYALDSLRLALFLPLTVLLDLDPAKLDELVDAMAGLFPVPSSYTEGVRRGLRRPQQPRPRPSEPFTGAAGPELRQALVRAISSSATPGRSDRLFPGDPAGLHDGGYTLAHGAAGVLHTLAVAGCPVDEEHLEWLWQAARRSPDPRPGLYGGLHGAALTLQALGRPQQGLELLDRAAGTRSASLHDGLAGIGLTLRQLLSNTGDAGLREPLAAVADRLVQQLERPTEPCGRPGLMHGAAGIAAFFLNCYQQDRDPAQLDLAATALRAELTHCRTSPQGAVNLQDGSRLLPYLGGGSGGVGLVIGQYLRYRHDEQFAQALQGTLLAARAPFVIHSNLFNGRAGLIALLARHRADPAAEAALQRHLRLLSWHAIPHRDGLAFPGEQLLRLSMDVATGTAGVLLALCAADGPDLELPGLADPPEQQRIEQYPRLSAVH